LGYLLSKNFLGKEASQTRFQPNIAIQYSDFEGLNEAMVVFDLGVNLFLKDNKLTLNYQNRPVYKLILLKSMIEKRK
jgi:hypothetical protein